MVEKISEIYTELFTHYLEFFPQYRRNLIILEDMHKWIKELDFGSPLQNESDLLIYMEWLSILNLLKPICLVKVPKPPEGTQFVINSYDIDKDHKEGLIFFPKDVYDIKTTIKNTLTVKPWDYSKHEIPRDDISEGYKVRVNKVHYLYHPLQFFNLMTYLQGNNYENIFRTKTYQEFYWKRKILLDDYLVKSIKEILSEKGGTIEEYVDKQVQSGNYFNQFLGIILSQNHWLTPERLRLWIKIESIFIPHFFKPSSNPDISMNVQLPYFQRWDQEKRAKKVNEINNAFKNYDENFKDFFDSNEFHKIREFRKSIEIYLRLDGLENFIDLFLLIKSEKKDKLKGRLSLFVNFIEIARILREAENRLIREYPELEEFKVEPKWYEPKYRFESEEEYNEYVKMVLLRYDIFQEDKFVIFVEGETELIILEDWLNFVYGRTGVKISLKSLGSKRSGFIFEYLIKNFEVHDFFLVLDADTKEYIVGKMANLKGKGINEDSIYIFYPDFVTENFSVQEILDAFKNYIIDTNNEIETDSKKIQISDSAYEKLEEDLISLKDQGFEEILENFLKIQLNDDRQNLKKTKFAENLRDEMRKNFRVEKGRTQYVFEKILGDFVTKIQMRQFPKER